MQTLDGQKTQRRGQSLVGILVSVFLLIGLAAFFLMPRGTGEDGKHEKTVLRKSMDRAEDVGTKSYLSQIQQGINMIKSDNDGKAPATLAELKHSLRDYPPEMWVNSVTKKPFIYDPVTGTICDDNGTGCPPGNTASAPAAPVAPGANPPAPGANPASPAAPSAPSGAVDNPMGVGGIHVPQPGAGAAEAMKDN